MEPLIQDGGLFGEVMDFARSQPSKISGNSAQLSTERSPERIGSSTEFTTLRSDPKFESILTLKLLSPFPANATSGISIRLSGHSAIHPCASDTARISPDEPRNPPRGLTPTPDVTL